MLAEFRSGKTRMFALPFNTEVGNAFSTISGFSAASAWISPSTVRVGSSSLTIFVALPKPPNMSGAWLSRKRKMSNSIYACVCVCVCLITTLSTEESYIHFSG